MNSLFSQIPAREQTFREGDVLIRSGEIPGKLMFLLEGRVEVMNMMQERILLDAPTILGEISLLSQSPALADVVAATPLRVRAISAEDWLAWGKRHPENLAAAYAELSRLAIRRLSGRFHERYVAVVAHDGRKSELMDFISKHRSFFASRALLATATTGRMVEDKLGLTVARRVLSGPVGGDQEIGALVSRGFVDAVFFYRDPLWAQPHQADVSALIRICELTNIPLATNNATAELLVKAMQ